MGFIEDHCIVVRNQAHSGGISGELTQLEVCKKKSMVDDEEAGASGFLASFVEKALTNVSTVFTPARVWMTTDIVPVAEHKWQICYIPSFRFLRPDLQLNKTGVDFSEEVRCGDIHLLVAEIVLSAF
jgi:hypothetical protein